MFSQDEVKLLTQLGLTTNQAKVYLTLVQNAPSTAYQISKSADLACEVVYRAMPALQEAGLAERLIAKPTIFQAVPVEQGIHSLLNRKSAEQKKLRRKTEALLDRIKTNHIENSQKSPQEGNDLTLVPGKEDIIQKLMESIKKTQKSLEVITTHQKFSSTILVFGELYKKAIARGVKIRIATEKHVIDRKALKILDSIQRDGSFQVRYFSDYPKAVVAIFDEEEAFITLSANGASALRSNSPCFTALAQSFFEIKWNNSIEADV